MKGTEKEEHLSQAQESEALWGEEAPGLHASEARGSGTSGYLRCSPISLGEFEAI